MTDIVEPNGPWMPTFSAHPFPMLDPEPEDIRWADIVFALAHINRFSGHVGAYSVAQHSCLVGENLLPDLKPYGLLHDAHEAFMGDITTPTKKALKAWGAGTSVHRLSDNLDRAIYLAAGLIWPVPRMIEEAVKIADRRAFITEVRDLNPRSPELRLHAESGDYKGLAPFPERIERWSPQQTIKRFGAALNAAGLNVSFSFLEA